MHNFYAYLCIHKSFHIYIHLIVCSVSFAQDATQLHEGGNVSCKVAER